MERQLIRLETVVEMMDDIGELRIPVERLLGLCMQKPPQQINNGNSHFHVLTFCRLQFVVII